MTHLFKFCGVIFPPKGFVSATKLFISVFLCTPLKRAPAIDGVLRIRPLVTNPTSFSKQSIKVQNYYRARTVRRAGCVLRLGRPKRDLYRIGECVLFQYRPRVFRDFAAVARPLVRCGSNFGSFVKRLPLPGGASPAARPRPAPPQLDR